MFECLRHPFLLAGLIPGWPELLLILFIVLLIFGSGKLADLGKGLGEGIRNFKKGMRGEDDEANTTKSGPKK
jgi:sec-independent protein translocase protein TatA